MHRVIWLPPRTKAKVKKKKALKRGAHCDTLNVRFPCVQSVKVGCQEGGCGACAVAVVTKDESGGCLFPGGAFVCFVSWPLSCVSVRWCVKARGSATLARQGLATITPLRPVAIVFTIKFMRKVCEWGPSPSCAGRPVPPACGPIEPPSPRSTLCQVVEGRNAKGST